MKCLVLVITLLVVMAGCPPASFAGNWEEYSAYKEQFYSLDKQQFNSISCKLDVPVLSSMVNGVKQQLMILPGNISATETVNEFSFAYGKDKTLQFNRPTFEITIKSEDELADPSRAKDAIKTIDASFSGAVDGVTQSVSGLFEDESPDRAAIEAGEVAVTKASLTAAYSMKGKEIIETFADNTRNTKTVDQAGELNTLESFEKTQDSKLIARAIAVKLIQPMLKVDSDVKITYQKVGGVVIPKRMTTDITIETQGMRQTGQIEINFNNCVVNQ